MASALVELFAVVMAMLTFTNEVRGRAILVFVDSEAVEVALVKGYSRHEDVCLLVARFWMVVEQVDCMVYIDRVSTDANISDQASRGNLDIVQRCGWCMVDGAWPQ